MAQVSCVKVVSFFWSRPLLFIFAKKGKLGVLRFSQEQEDLLPQIGLFRAPMLSRCPKHSSSIMVFEKRQNIVSL